MGKAERSLASRDVDTHFSTAKTGSSTLRRSLAGLLVDQLALEGRPRNPAKPERFANSRWLDATVRLPGTAERRLWRREPNGGHETPKKA